MSIFLEIFLPITTPTDILEVGFVIYKIFQLIVVILFLWGGEMCKLVAL